MGLNIVWQHSSAQSLQHEHCKCTAISLIPHLHIFLSQFNRLIFFLLKKAFPRRFQVRCTNEEAGKLKLTEGTTVGSVHSQPVGFCFLIPQCLNKVRMQEEVEKDLAYLTDIYLYTIPDKGLWEICVLICMNESFSNCLRLVRNFNWHVSSKSLFLYFCNVWQWLPSEKAFRKTGFQTGICGSTSGCGHMYVGVSTTQKSKHRKAVLLAYSQKRVNTFTDSFYWFAYGKGLEVARALCQSDLPLVFPGGPAF